MKDVNVLSELIVSNVRIECLLKELIFQVQMIRTNGNKEESLILHDESMLHVQDCAKAMISSMTGNEDGEAPKQGDYSFA